MLFVLGNDILSLGGNGCGQKLFVIQVLAESFWISVFYLESFFKYQFKQLPAFSRRGKPRDNPRLKFQSQGNSGDLTY